MIGITDFKSNVKNIDWFFVNLKEIGLRRGTLFAELHAFQSFMSIFNCTPSELVEITERLGIDDRSLFEYSISTSPFLVSRNGIYTEKWKNVNGHYDKVTTFYDVYVTNNSYVSLYLNKVAQELVKKNMPYLLGEQFSHTARRFDKEFIKELPTNLNTSVSDVLYKISPFATRLSVGDLVKLYTDPTYKDSLITEYEWSVYHDGNLYIHIDEDKPGYSIHTNYRTLLSKNWEAIENQRVFSIPLYNPATGKMMPKKSFEGKQKDAPYFDNDKVKLIKAYLTL